MTLQEIANLRLINQQVAATRFDSAGELVAWMGAMQAQEYNMSKWAIGLRVNGSTEKIIEAAIDKGEILRTHVLRPTWHFVSAHDIYPLLTLTAPRIKASMKARDNQLELNETIYSKSYSILVKALEGGRHLTREELTPGLKAARINTSENRLSHILMHAELDKIICSGKNKGNRQTYALLPERVPETRLPHRDEILAKLANTYFTSHGPATLKDFTWWSGLSSGDVKHALEMAKTNLVSDRHGDEIYWFADPAVTFSPGRDSVFALPAFDEFIISYRDRSAVLPSANHKAAVSNNGVFRPVIIQNVQVSGIWKRTIKNRKVILETGMFELSDQITRAQIAGAFQKYITFTGKEAELL